MSATALTLAGAVVSVAGASIAAVLSYLTNRDKHRLDASGADFSHLQAEVHRVVERNKELELENLAWRFWAIDVYRALRSANIEVPVPPALVEIFKEGE